MPPSLMSNSSQTILTKFQKLIILKATKLVLFLNLGFVLLLLTPFKLLPPELCPITLAHAQELDILEIATELIIDAGVDETEESTLQVLEGSEESDEPGSSSFSSPSSSQVSADSSSSSASSDLSALQRQELQDRNRLRDLGHNTGSSTQNLNSYSNSDSGAPTALFSPNPPLHVVALDEINDENIPLAYTHLLPPRQGITPDDVPTTYGVRGYQQNSTELRVDYAFLVNSNANQSDSEPDTPFVRGQQIWIEEDAAALGSCSGRNPQIDTAIPGTASIQEVNEVILNQTTHQPILNSLNELTYRTVQRLVRVPQSYADRQDKLAHQNLIKRRELNTIKHITGSQLFDPQNVQGSLRRYVIELENPLKYCYPHSTTYVMAVDVEDPGSMCDVQSLFIGGVMRVDGLEEVEMPGVQEGAAEMNVAELGESLDYGRGGVSLVDTGQRQSGEVDRESELVQQKDRYQKERRRKFLRDFYKNKNNTVIPEELVNSKFSPLSTLQLNQSAHLAHPASFLQTVTSQTSMSKFSKTQTNSLHKLRHKLHKLKLNQTTLTVTRRNTTFTQLHVHTHYERLSRTTFEQNLVNSHYHVLHERYSDDCCSDQSAIRCPATAQCVLSCGPGMVRVRKRGDASGRIRPVSDDEVELYDLDTSHRHNQHVTYRCNRPSDSSGQGMGGSRFEAEEDNGAELFCAYVNYTQRVNLMIEVGDDEGEGGGSEGFGDDDDEYYYKRPQISGMSSGQLSDASNSEEGGSQTDLMSSSGSSEENSDSTEAIVTVEDEIREKAIAVIEKSGILGKGVGHTNAELHKAEVLSVDAADTPVVFTQLGLETQGSYENPFRDQLPDRSFLQMDNQVENQFQTQNQYQMPMSNQDQFQQQQQYANQYQLQGQMPMQNSQQFQTQYYNQQNQDFAQAQQQQFPNQGWPGQAVSVMENEPQDDPESENSEQLFSRAEIDENQAELEQQQQLAGVQQQVPMTDQQQFVPPPLQYQFPQQIQFQPQPYPQSQPAQAYPTYGPDASVFQSQDVFGPANYPSQYYPSQGFQQPELQLTSDQVPPAAVEDQKFIETEVENQQTDPEKKFMIEKPLSDSNSLNSANQTQTRTDETKSEIKVEDVVDPNTKPKALSLESEANSSSLSDDLVELVVNAAQNYENEKRKEAETASRVMASQPRLQSLAVVKTKQTNANGLNSKTQSQKTPEPEVLNSAKPEAAVIGKSISTLSMPLQNLVSDSKTTSSEISSTSGTTVNIESSTISSRLTRLESALQLLAQTSTQLNDKSKLYSLKSDLTAFKEEISQTLHNENLKSQDLMLKDLKQTLHAQVEKEVHDSVEKQVREILQNQNSLRENVTVVSQARTDVTHLTESNSALATSDNLKRLLDLEKVLPGELSLMIKERKHICNLIERMEGRLDSMVGQSKKGDNSQSETQKTVTNSTKLSLIQLPQPGPNLAKDQVQVQPKPQAKAKPFAKIRARMNRLEDTLQKVTQEVIKLRSEKESNTNRELDNKATTNHANIFQQTVDHYLSEALRSSNTESTKQSNSDPPIGTNPLGIDSVDLLEANKRKNLRLAKLFLQKEVEEELENSVDGTRGKPQIEPLLDRGEVEFGQQFVEDNDDGESSKLKQSDIDEVKSLDGAALLLMQKAVAPVQVKTPKEFVSLAREYKDRVSGMRLPELREAEARDLKPVVENVKKEKSNSYIPQFNQEVANITESTHLQDVEQQLEREADLIQKQTQMLKGQVIPNDKALQYAHQPSNSETETVTEDTVMHVKATNRKSKSSLSPLPKKFSLLQTSAHAHVNSPVAPAQSHVQAPVVPVNQEASTPASTAISEYDFLNLRQDAKIEADAAEKRVAGLVRVNAMAPGAQPPQQQTVQQQPESLSEDLEALKSSLMSTTPSRPKTKSVSFIQNLENRVLSNLREGAGMFEHTIDSSTAPASFIQLSSKLNSTRSNIRHRTKIQRNFKSTVKTQPNLRRKVKVSIDVSGKTKTAIQKRINQALHNFASSLNSTTTNLNSRALQSAQKNLQKHQLYSARIKSNSQHKLKSKSQSFQLYNTYTVSDFKTTLKLASRLNNGDAPTDVTEEDSSDNDSDSLTTASRLNPSVLSSAPFSLASQVILRTTRVISIAQGVDADGRGITNPDSNNGNPTPQFQAGDQILIGSGGWGTREFAEVTAVEDGGRTLRLREPIRTSHPAMTVVQKVVVAEGGGR